MRTITLCKNFTRTYKNNGQHLEQWFRFTLTGKIERADNIAHNKGTDFLNYSIKSAKATVCKGTDLDAYLDTDKATEFVYITKSGIAYIMARAIYTEFVKAFSYVTEGSSKDKGTKLRLKDESRALLQWLEDRA